MSFRYYVHDLESDKYQVHTDGKSDWLSLPEKVQSDIKRNCLWSGSRKCWVSKAKGGGCWLKQILDEAGFEYRGTVGERMDFATQQEQKAERAEYRAERYEARADAAKAESMASYRRSHEMMDAIPLGQPILIGHHSEKRDRNYRDRAWNLMGASVAADKKAKHYTNRADAANRAANQLELKNPRYLNRRIKETDAEIRMINRRLAGKFYTYSKPEPISDEYRNQLSERLAVVTDKRDFYTGKLVECEECAA